MSYRVSMEGEGDEDESELSGLEESQVARDFMDR